MADVSTTELRARGFPINRRRKRPHPKLTQVEAQRLRRAVKNRPLRRTLWLRPHRPHRELPITMRAHTRYVREYMRRNFSFLNVRVWPKPPPGLL